MTSKSGFRAPGAAARRGLLSFAFAFAAGLLWSGAASAAGFDCGKASSPVERLVCGDPDLNAFDSQLDGAYRGALDRSADPAAVKDGQLAWLKQRNACTEAACLAASYQRRIKLLEAISDKPAICEHVGSTPELDACQAEYSRRADRELARYVAAARKRLTDDSRDAFTGGSAKAALAEFDAAQAAWGPFRKAECSAVYTQHRGGTIRGSMYETCWRRMTEDRTRSVWVNWLQYMDSTPPVLLEPKVRD